MSISSCLLTAAESNPLLSWGAVGAGGAPWGPLAKVVQSGCVPTLFGLTGACCYQRHSCPSCVLTSCPLPISVVVPFAQVASATCPQGTREVYSSTAACAGVRCLCKHASSSPLPLTASLSPRDLWPLDAVLVVSCDLVSLAVLIRKSSEVFLGFFFPPSCRGHPHGSSSPTGTPSTSRRGRQLPQLPAKSSSIEQGELHVRVVLISGVVSKAMEVI